MADVLIHWYPEGEGLGPFRMTRADKENIKIGRLPWGCPADHFITMRMSTWKRFPERRARKRGGR